MSTLHIGEIAGDSRKLLNTVYDFGHQLEIIPDGSGASHFGGPEGWIHRLDMVRIDPHSCPPVMRAIGELRLVQQVGRLVQTMVNRLRPGGELRVHRDGLPDNLRYHLPLITSPKAFWWDEINGYIHMDAGNWYGPVPYCGVLHSAGNPSDVDRVHLICDFERR